MVRVRVSEYLEVMSSTDTPPNRPHAGAVGVGIIGLGFMGRTHLAAYAANSRASVRALCDPAAAATASGGNLINPGSEGVAQMLATLPREHTVAALLARADVELVSICTPTDSHVDLVRAAIAAGKHVLVEKPVALDAKEIRALDREAKAAGVLVMPAHCMRFWPAWAWMAQAVQTKRYGRPLRASFRRLGARPTWSQEFYLDITRSGGAIIDLHIHDADFVRFAFGEPATVTARGDRMHVHARYSYADGLEIEAEGGWMDDPKFAFMMVATIECERGIIDFRIGRDPELCVLEEGVERPIATGIDYPLGAGYEHEIDALLQSVLESSTEAPVTLREAAATQELLDREIALLQSG